jgi:hypothetical protein
MDSSKEIARAAGLLYLIVILTGIFSLMYVPSHLSGHGDALATIDHISASRWLFRWGALVELVQYAVFVVLAFILYRLLQQVDQLMAGVMVALVVIGMALSMAAVVHKLDILSLLDNDAVGKLLSADQVNAQQMLSLDAYDNGILLAKIFWGLWLFPFGYLVFRSGFLPRILGILLMLGCFSYVIDFFGNMLVSGYADTQFADLIMLPSGLGELGICLWLLIMGRSADTGR